MDVVELSTLSPELEVYTINWHLPEAIVEVRGIGNVLTLEDAQVVRVAVEG